AGAFFPGFMLAALYIGYVIVLAKWKPELMPPLKESERHVELPDFAQKLKAGNANALTGLWRAVRGDAGVAKGTAWTQFGMSLLPALAIAGIIAVTYQAATAPIVEESTAGLQEAGGAGTLSGQDEPETDLAQVGGLAEPPSEDAGTPAKAAEPVATEPQSATKMAEATPESALQPPAVNAHERLPVPGWFWIVFGICVAIAALTYWLWSWERFEVFKFLLSSFFPLAVLILAVLGSIVFGLATPTEAAAVGALGG